MFEIGIPGASFGYGAQQIGPQGYGSYQGLQSQRFAPYSALPGTQGIGYPAGQSVLPLTLGPGTIPFQLAQPPLGQQQIGQQPFGQQPFGQQPFGVSPFSQPSLLQSQLQQPQYQQLQFQQPQLQVIPVVTPQGWVAQLVLVNGQPLGIATGYGTPQIQQSPWSTAWYGYGVPQIAGPQIAPQSQIGGFTQQLPQTYVPMVPFGATPTPFVGQPLATSAMH